MPVPASVRSDLAAADALVADGRLVDAIDLLTRANRAAADPDLEASLVALRHRAFPTIKGAPAFESWPRTDVPELFPDVDGPPEIVGSDLSADLLASGIVRHGCLLVRGAVTAEQVDRLVHAIDAAFAAFEANEAGAPASETAPWFVPFRPEPPYKVGFGRQWTKEAGGVWMVDSPRALSELVDIIETSGLARAITGYLGERPALSARKSTLRRVPLDTSTDWHQDGAFLGAGVRSCNVWLSLSHCGTDAPGLDIVPARLPEVLETGTHGAMFDWSVGPDLVEAVAADVGVVSPVFAPGDVLLFDDLFLHRTGIRPGMTRERYAIESWFFAPSTYPDEQIPLAF